MKFFTTVSGFINNGDLNFIPIGHGTQLESSVIRDDDIDQVNFIIPFDLTITKAYLNVTRQTNTNAQPGQTKLSLWKAGEKHSDDMTVDIQGVGYDTFDLHHVHVFDFKNTGNDYLAGEVMQISMECEGLIQYYSMTITGDYVEEKGYEEEETSNDNIRTQFEGQYEYGDGTPVAANELIHIMDDGTVMTGGIHTEDSVQIYLKEEGY